MGKRDYGSGSIYERSPGHWRVEIELPADPVTGKRRRDRFTVVGAKRDAQRALRDALRERDDGHAIESNRVTTGEWLGRWLTSYRAEGNVSAMTFQRYEVVLRRHLVPVIGHVRLQDLQRHHVADLVTRWTTGKDSTAKAPQRPATVKKQLTVLRQALAGAVSASLIRTNPAEDIKTPPVAGSDEKRALTEAETRSLLEAARGTSIEVPARFAILTGIRQSELLGLKWEDFEPDRKVVRIRRSLSRIGKGQYNEPKGRRRRTIELSDATVEMLTRHRAEQNARRLRLGSAWEDHDLVFPTRRGTPRLARNLLRAHRRILDKTDIADHASVTWHTLRHTATSLWLTNGGASTFEVSRRLGHSSTRTTEQVYAHPGVVVVKRSPRANAPEMPPIAKAPDHT